MGWLERWIQACLLHYGTLDSLQDSMLSHKVLMYSYRQRREQAIFLHLSTGERLGKTMGGERGIVFVVRFFVTKGSYSMEQPTYRQNQFEHAMLYTRPDGQRIELALTHLPGSTPVLCMATFQEGVEGPVKLSSEFSLEEVRMVCKFYKQIEADGLLD